MGLINRTTISGLALGLALAAASPAKALDGEIGDVSWTFDTTISAGALFRVQDQANGNVGRANGGSRASILSDDGNLNYDKGLVSAALRATHEGSLEYENVGAFVRFSYFYDFVNAQDDNTDFKDLSDSAVERAGRDFDLLDAYVYGDFELGDMPLNVRVGNQVLSWGESTFIQNGINTINPINASDIRIPGSEVRNALVPVPIVAANLGLTDNLSVEAFYQVQWEETEPDAAGTYFSTNDFASPGGEFVHIGFGLGLIDDDPDQPPVGLADFDDPNADPALAASINPLTGNSGGLIAPFGAVVPRGNEREADDHGQFGAAVRYFSPELNDTEFGAYFINYHSRLPLISAQTGSFAALAAGLSDVGADVGNDIAGGRPLGGDVEDYGGVSYFGDSRYYNEYPEDIQLFGASFNTSFMGIAFQGEYSFRKDQPLQIDDVELLQASATPAIVSAQCNALLNADLSSGDATTRNTARGACQRSVGLVQSNQVIADIGTFDSVNPLVDVTDDAQFAALQTDALAAANSMFESDIAGYREFDVSQAQMTVTNVFPPALMASQWVLVGEAGVTHIHDMPSKSSLRLEGPGTVFGGNPNFLGVAGMTQVQTDGFPDATSWGYRIRGRFDYLDAIGGVNLFPTFAWSHDVHGTTPSPIGNFVEDRKAVSVGLQATYLSAWSGEVQYTSFFGGEDFNLIHDRDFVSLNLKYSF